MTALLKQSLVKTIPESRICRSCFNRSRLEPVIYRSCWRLNSTSSLPCKLSVREGKHAVSSGFVLCCVALPSAFLASGPFDAFLAASLGQIINSVSVGITILYTTTTTQRGVVYRSCCLNSRTFAVSEMASRRWSCIESLFPV